MTAATAKGIAAVRMTKSSIRAWWTIAIPKSTSGLSRPGGKCLGRVRNPLLPEAPGSAVPAAARAEFVPVSKALPLPFELRSSESTMAAEGYRVHPVWCLTGRSHDLQ